MDGGADNVLSQILGLNLQNNLEQLSMVPDSQKKKKELGCGVYSSPASSIHRPTAPMPEGEKPAGDLLPMRQEEEEDGEEEEPAWGVLNPQQQCPLAA